MGDVIVVGGGPAGSVAALLLARQAEHVVVLEREPDTAAAAGAGILLQPNGLAVLYALGLREALAEQSVTHRAAQVYNDRGTVVADAFIPDFGEGLDHALALRRSRLAEILKTAMSAVDNIELRASSTVSAVDCAAGEVAVASGSARYSMTGDLVVGADGVGSCVRRAGRFGARPVRGGRTYARMLVEGEFESLGAECWTPLGLFGASPLGDGSTYAFASVHVPKVKDAVHHKDLAQFVQLWSAALPAATPLLTRIPSIDSLLINEVGRVRCRRFVDGRSVLIGDAAHAMAPNLGQGANSAFVDAAVLAREIHDCPDPAAALVGYQRARRRPVTAVQRNADLLASAAHLQNHLARAIRDRVFRATNRPRLVARQVRATQQVDPAQLHRSVRGLVNRDEG